MGLYENRIVRILPLVLCTLAIFFLIFWQHYHYKVLPEKPIVAVITSFNNAKWVYKNLDSIFAQDYKNFRVIYCDDCSTDGTGDLVETYIKERNLADKIVLIRNKKRAIKLLNLYTIHHSIDDGDIIAQIDGDDWLADDQVFKEVNKAYHKGCWLAYTQFKCSNGEMGGNKMPPYWVRKNGSFREYKPTWFMYSHLKTFYAWLFKQIKLHDFIDDKAGTFPGVNDDVLMMYPMLEMARDHFTFIPKICYIWNVSPGFRYMPETDTMTDLQKIFFKKPAYPALREPVLTNAKLFENEIVDIVLFSSCTNKQQLDNVLQSIKKNIKGSIDLYVICQRNNQALQDLQAHYPEVHFVDYTECFQLMKHIHNYVIFADDYHEVTQEISVATCIKEMERTFAHAFYLEPLLVLQEKNNALQVIHSNILAYKYGAEKNINTMIHTTNWVLYRKEDAEKFFSEQFTLSNNGTLYHEKRRPIDLTKIGLLFEKSPLKKSV
jgi:glycosyltransferase involved in cell wall biosynthesis